MCPAYDSCSDKQGHMGVRDTSYKVLNASSKELKLLPKVIGGKPPRLSEEGSKFSLEDNSVINVKNEFEPEDRILILKS